MAGHVVKLLACFLIMHTALEDACRSSYSPHSGDGIKLKIIPDHSMIQRLCCLKKGEGKRKEGLEGKGG